MNSEYQILKEINEDSNTTQRDLAFRTGMSLGNVNILIKRLVKKGLLKMERINSRTMKYVLTPRGLKEKAETIYRYIVSSSRYIGRLESVVCAIMKAYNLRDGSKVYLYGNSDEVFEIIRNTLKRQRIKTVLFSRIEEIRKENTEGMQFIMLWQQQREEELNDVDIKCINLLKIL